MLSLINLRLIPAFSARILRFHVARAPSTYAQTRSFLTTTHWAFPAKPAATAKPKSKVKKATATKAKAKPKTKGKAKATPKARPKVKAKKAAPKKKIVVKEPVIKYSKADLPPKKPLTPFFQFAQEYRRDHPDTPPVMSEMQALIKNCAETWRGMTDAEKQVYRDKFEASKEGYAAKLDEWKNNIDPKVLRVINQRRVKRGVRRLKGKVEKSNRISPFFIYLNELRANTVVDNQPAFVSQAGASWNALSQAEKDKYRAAAAEKRTQSLQH